MTNPHPTSVAASVRQKLLNLARQSGRSFLISSEVVVSSNGLILNQPAGKSSIFPDEFNTWPRSSSREQPLQAATN